MLKQCAILVSGRGSNMRVLIKACQAKQIPAEIAVVVGHHAHIPALVIAHDQGIKTAYLEHNMSATEQDEQLCQILLENHVDYVLLAGYIKKIEAKTINQFRHRIINVHPSLLPKYGGQGMYGIKVHEAVLAAVEQKTGATIHLVDDYYDQGKILAQESLAIKADHTPQSLAADVLVIEHRLFPQTVAKFICDQAS